MVYVLSCPDYVQHHSDNTRVEQVNGNIPLKTQQRIEAVTSLFPSTQVCVLFADSEVTHEGKIEDADCFTECINNSKQRVSTKYPEVEASTFFEQAGGIEEFLNLRKYFFEILRRKVKLRYDERRPDTDSSLTQTLEYERARTAQRLKSRALSLDPAELAERILCNSFAEMLPVGEILKSKHSNPDGTCSAAVIFDQSAVTGLINDGDKHGSKLKRGLSPVPIILANSTSTV